MSAATLNIHQVSKHYRPRDKRRVEIIRLLDLELSAGDFVAVRGPSGCGKTTLLLMAGGLLKPDSGQVLIGGSDPYEFSTEARARFRAQHIGFVFQQFHLVPYLSVLDNVLAPSLAFSGGGGRDRANELVAHFGLQHRAHHLPAELSTGEQQRVALARALLNQPKLLLADEPTGNLDPDNAQVVLHYLSEYTSNGGTLLLVTHEDRALPYAHCIYDLKEGKAVPS